MSVSERWGTFSVTDHKNAASLVPEVLLYDRLVIPVPSNDNENQRWKERGWSPELLDQRLEILDDLAIRVPWNQERQKIYHDKLHEINQVKFDANNLVEEIKQSLPYHLTRTILAQEQRIALSKDLSRIVVVAAYQSEEDFKADFILQQSPSYSRGSNLALLLGQKLAVPADKNPEKALDKAIELAKNSDFKRQRRKLYTWQENIIREGIDERAALNEMQDLINEYNDCVKAATRKVYYKLAFTVAGVALSLAGGALVNPWATAGAFISLAQFITVDRKPVIQGGESEPAAMFHTANKKIFGWPRFFGWLR